MGFLWQQSCTGFIAQLNNKKAHSTDERNAQHNKIESIPKDWTQVKMMTTLLPSQDPPKCSDQVMAEEQQHQSSEEIQ